MVVVDGRRLARRVLARPARPLGELLGVTTKRRTGALTFDDGPDPDWTPLLLSILERHGVQATFFLVGANAAAHPGLVEVIRAAGHEIGNHTYHHRSLVLESPSTPVEAARWRHEEITRTASLLRTGPGRWLRAPYGHVSFPVAAAAALARHRLVGWDAPAGDWANDSPDVLVRRTLDRLGLGGIVLFHDRLATTANLDYLPRAATIAAVDRLLTETHRRGFDWVTVSQLSTIGPPRLRFHWPPPTRAALALLNSTDPAALDEIE